MTETIVDIKGSLCGLRLKKRGSKDNHITAQLIIEDDGHWHESGVTISSFWLDDLEKVVKETIEYLDNNHEKVKFGYEYL